MLEFLRPQFLTESLLSHYLFLHTHGHVCTCSVACSVSLRTLLNFLRDYVALFSQPFMRWKLHHRFVIQKFNRFHALDKEMVKGRWKRTCRNKIFCGHWPDNQWNLSPLIDSPHSSTVRKSCFQCFYLWFWLILHLSLICQSLQFFQ